ncbi:MAG TPA: hypothetical protein VEK38_02775 [Candidatus Bathyarchaeia archaeon]|nr:hypothetical protein [Candidatus Bathyarchaeia archaeon]
MKRIKIMIFFAAALSFVENVHAAAPGNIYYGDILPYYSPTIVSFKSYRSDTKIYAVPAVWVGEWECNFSAPLSTSGSSPVMMEMRLSSLEGVCFIVVSGNMQREFLVHGNDTNPDVIMYSQDGGTSRKLCNAGDLNAISIIIRSDGSFAGVPVQE